MNHTYTDAPKPLPESPPEARGEVAPEEDTEKGYVPADEPVPDLPPEPAAPVPATPTDPHADPDMPGGVPLAPTDPDAPVRPESGDDTPKEPEEEILEDLIQEEQQEPVPPS